MKEKFKTMKECKNIIAIGAVYLERAVFFHLALQVIFRTNLNIFKGFASVYG